MVSPLSVEMDTVGFNTTARYYLAIINTGVQDLTVSDIQSTNSQFTIDQTSMVLPPETYDYLEISFTSEETEGSYSTTIQITSNDPNEGFIEVPVSIQVAESISFVEPSSVPHTMALLQNYPNPFNPVTTIRYALNKSGHVQLSVYDSAGRLIGRLVNQQQKAGQFSVLFDGRNLPSGVYFYQLKAAGFTQVKKMLLLK
ncbi:T9SS type A sorting domain-containing protein [Calditrichota bacterium GD2]